MAFLNGNIVGRKICEAIGLDPRDVKSIDIHLAVNDLATITIRRFASADEIEAIDWSISSQYFLVSRKKVEGQ
jgi:hypothetical protein